MKFCQLFDQIFYFNSFLLVTPLVIFYNNLVMLDQSVEVIVLDVEFVVVKSSLVCDLVRDVLGVMSGQQTLIDTLNLFWVLHHVSKGKLGHLNVVGKHVEWEVLTLGNGDEFKVSIVWQVLVVQLLHGDVTTSTKGSDW